MKLQQLLEDIVAKYSRPYPSKLYSQNVIPIYKLSEKTYKQDISEILSKNSRGEMEFRFIANPKTKDVYAFSLDITHFQASKSLGIDYDTDETIEGFGKSKPTGLYSIDPAVKNKPWLNKFIKYDELKKHEH